MLFRSLAKSLGCNHFFGYVCIRASFITGFNISGLGRTRGHWLTVHWDGQGVVALGGRIGCNPYATRALCRRPLSSAMLGRLRLGRRARVLSKTARVSSGRGRTSASGAPASGLPTTVTPGGPIGPWVGGDLTPGCGGIHDPVIPPEGVLKGAGCWKTPFPAGHGRVGQGQVGEVG